ncbi:MAG: aminopeptidase [Candidatus Aureabacteria bacterium]|nr:aminopeptidase [Candidatus Auribacterota bacterium]
MINESAVKSVFEKSFKLQDSESCLIITDINKRKIADVFFDYAQNIVGYKAKIIEIPVGTRHGEEPPSDVVVQMLLFDCELLITTCSLSHTTARRNASRNGIRIASMPDITEEMINRCLDMDYDKLQLRCGKLHEDISACSEVTLKTDLGTNITFKKEDRSIHGKKGATLDQYGAFGNLPDGEICFAPSSSNGVCFIDASIAGIGKLFEPVKVIIENNIAISIEGKESDKLRSILDKVGERAYHVAELGIGTNDKAIITGKTLEDEKVKGTAHIAFGNNLSFGGNNDVPLHIDCVMQNAQIFLDGKKLIMSA